jgi:hypothetical protein
MTGTLNELIMRQIVSTVGNFNENLVFKYLFSGTQVFMDAPEFLGYDKSFYSVHLSVVTLKATCAEI